MFLWYFDFVLQRRFFSHLELSHRRLPNIWLRDQHSDPIGTISTQAYGLLKKATCPSRRFLVAPAPNSLRFLCPRLPLLLCVPNQNHHATQATKEAIGEWVKKSNVQNVILLHTFRRLTVLKDETSSFDSAYNNYYFFLLQVRDFPVNQTKMGSLTMRHSGFTDMHFWNSQYHNSRCGL